ncbi:MAG: PKD domain-containing protein, partial [Bacteroidales bacterium]|nr:PKD domain-containing protein [Bacteroidales bacterium]
VPEVTIPIVGPFIQIDSVLKESCLNPKGLNITYQLFDAGKAHFVLTNVKTNEIFDTIVDFGVDTTLTETLSLELPTGFYDIQYGSYNYANGKEYLMYLTYWDIQHMVAYKKNKIIAVSGVVEANFSDAVDKACWNDLIPYDYSASKNGVVFEWFKIQEGNKERLPIMYPFYAPFEDTLICEAEPDRCTDLSRAYSAFANCNLAYSSIDTSKANVVFCENGLFDVQLVVTAVNGCTDTATITNTIRLYKPEAQLKVSDATSCDSDTVKFWLSDITTDTTIISYHIDYGNGGDNEFFSDSLASVDYAYKKGYYLPELTVTDTMLCASSEIISLDVTKPDANISAPSYVCRESSFSLSSNNVHDSYDWIFGDGESNLNTKHKVNHAYDTGGDYKVHLTVYNEHGCKDTISTIVHALNEPEINIGIADSVADCPIYILEMSDEGNNIQINYREWILTNNTIDEPVFPVLSSSPLAVLPLIHPGNYSLSYSINSMVCETQYANFDNFFNLGGPYLKMMELDDYYCQQDTILLTPDSSSIINSPIFVKWSFEQKDGVVNQFSDLETKTSLTDSGTYTTYLHYTDSMFCDQFDSVSFEVSNFSSDFQTGDNICEIPTKFDIQIESNDMLQDYYWLFNSDTIVDTVVNKNLTDTIKKFNIYPVKLVSTGNDGCKYVVNKELKAYAPPTAIIFNNDTIICENDKVQMRTYGEKNYLYKWTPSNGIDNDSIQNAIISPLDDSQYFLNIKDDSTGCTDVDTITILVQDKPESELFYSFDTLHWMDFTPPLEVPYSDTLDLMVETNQANVTYSWTITNAYYECQGDSIVDNNCSRIGIAIEEDNDFYLVVQDSLGCYSQNFDINLETTIAQILMPTSFSPNGDGINDDMGVNGPGINEILEFKVFDNSGALVFETDDITDSWNGTYKGKDVAIGRYFYHVKAVVTGTNEIIEQQGSVKL